MFDRPQGGNIPEDQIAPDDVDKFLIRSALMTYPKLHGKYQKLIEPLKYGEVRSIEDNLTAFLGRFAISRAMLSETPEDKLFEQFVTALQNMKKEYADKPFSNEIATKYRNNAVAIATDFCTEAEKQNISSMIFPQLAVIKENIQSREVVQNYTRYAARKGYGTF